MSLREGERARDYSTGYMGALNSIGPLLLPDDEILDADIGESGHVYGRTPLPYLTVSSKRHTRGKDDGRGSFDVWAGKGNAFCDHKGASCKVEETIPTLP